MPVDEEPPVLLTATDVPRFLEELPVGARAGKPVTCRGTVRSRRRTAAHTFVMLSLEDGAGGSEGRSTAEADGRAIVQLVLPGAHSAEPALWCEPYLSPGAELSCCGAPGCDRAESLSVYVTSVVLERAAPEPSSLARLLDAVTARTWGGTAAGAATALACDQAHSASRTRSRTRNLNTLAHPLTRNSQPQPQPQPWPGGGLPPLPASGRARRAQGGPRRAVAAAAWAARGEAAREAAGRARGRERRGGARGGGGRSGRVAAR